MAEPVRHRQTKEAVTDMFDLQPPRHIPTLPKTVLAALKNNGRSTRSTDIIEPARLVRFVPEAVTVPASSLGRVVLPRF
jgi:uncharacterized protein YabE (DUF348 family)